MNQLSLLVIDLLSLIAIFVAVVRIVTSPADRWPWGRLSKAAWICGAIYFTFTIHYLIIPVGAAVALRHVRRLPAPPATEPAPLPFADGETDAIGEADAAPFGEVPEEVS